MGNSKHSERSTIYTSSYLKKRQSISYKSNQLRNKNMNRLLHLKGTKRYLRRPCNNSIFHNENNGNINRVFKQMYHIDEIQQMYWKYGKSHKIRNNKK